MHLLLSWMSIADGIFALSASINRVLKRMGKRRQSNIRSKPRQRLCNATGGTMYRFRCRRMVEGGVTTL